MCSPSSASSAPSAVDTSGETLITFTAYNSAGEVWQTTASDGSYTQSFFDDAGRPMGTIEYDRFGSTILSTGTTYGAGDLVATSSTTTSSGTDTTAYDYGTTVDTSTPSLFTNDAVAEILYPGSTNPVKYTFNRQGQMTTMTDQNETTHTYTYDGDGRLLADSVSVPTDNPANIDMTVQSIRYAYQACGRLDTVTSYDSPYDPSEPTSGDIVNQVKYAYDTYGNMIGEYQQQGSAVDMSTSLYVGYGYDTSTTTTDGITTSNTDFRPTSLQYPTTGTNTSRTITYNYTGSDAQAGIDDAINRLDSVGDGDGTGTADEPTVTPPALESLTYLGTDTVIKQDYGQPNVELDYAGTSSGSYPGLDQFDRVINQVWKEIGSDPSILDAYGYGRDAAGNVTYRKNNTASGLDQVYTNDYLGQLTSLEQGQIATTTVDGNTVVSVNSSGNASLSSTANLSESWAPDGTGNWTSFSESSTTTSALDQSEMQTPTGNNQIGTLGSGSTWAQPAYDAAGNMTTIPQPGNPSVGMGGKYDAWGRLTQVTVGSTMVTLSYDGLGRMVSRTVGTSVTYYLYAGQQVLETRTGAVGDSVASSPIQYQYVWSPTGINVPILRDTYVDGTAVSADRLYYLTDANGNVTAVTDDTGEVQERYSYDAYGNVTIYDADWVQRSSSSVNNTLLFAGMMVDPTTGLYYARARWYNPATGTFITQDPAQADVNPYRYAGNDPISESDPTGLFESGESSNTTTPGPAECGSSTTHVANVVIHINKKDMPSNFNVARVQERLNQIAAKTGSRVTIILVDNEVPKSKLGFRFDSIYWTNTGAAGGWGWYPLYWATTPFHDGYVYFTRRVNSYEHYVQFNCSPGHGSFAGTFQSYQSNLYVVNLTTALTGHSNDQIDRTYANTLFHEVFYFGVTKHTADFDTSNAGTFDARQTTDHDNTVLTDDEVTQIKRYLTRGPNWATSLKDDE